MILPRFVSAAWVSTLFLMALWVVDGTATATTTTTTTGTSVSAASATALPSSSNPAFVDNPNNKTNDKSDDKATSATRRKENLLVLSKPFLGNVTTVLQQVSRQTTAALQQAVQRVDYQQCGRQVQNATKLIFHTSRTLVQHGSAVMSMSMTKYWQEWRQAWRRQRPPPTLSPREAAMASRYRIVSGLVGLLLVLFVTGPAWLHWWTDDCLKQRIASCGSVVAGSVSLGFGLGRECGSVLFHIVHDRRQRQVPQK